ncbi:MAG: hypothetical protein R3D00_14165 [Bacteroidia bacterium]
MPDWLWTITFYDQPPGLDFDPYERSATIFKSYTYDPRGRLLRVEQKTSTTTPGHNSSKSVITNTTSGGGSANLTNPRRQRRAARIGTCPEYLKYGLCNNLFFHISLLFRIINAIEKWKKMICPINPRNLRVCPHTPL